MSPPDHPDAAPPGSVRALADQLPRLARVLHALKTQVAAEGRDRAALLLLLPLAAMGPLRQSALAETIHIDPSTVSRHVAVLVEQGLVRRVADETDGRASRLVVTDAGHEALDQLRQERATCLEKAMTGWSTTDIATLTTLIGRLVEDVRGTLPLNP